MKIGVFTVCMPDYEPVRAMEFISALGYDGIEWRNCVDTGDREHPGFWSGNRCGMTSAEILERADQLKEVAGTMNLEMPTIAAYLGCYDLDLAEEAFRAANAIGAKSVRVNATGFQPDKPYWEQVEANRAQIGLVEKLATRYHVKAMLETHMGLLNPTVVSTMDIIRGMDPEHIGLIWDPGNQVTEGLERYDMAINAAGPYLAEVHVKNYTKTPHHMENGNLVWTTTCCQLQSGVVNWPAVIAELKKANYNGWLMIEDFNTLFATDEKLKNNIEFLRGPCGVTR